MKAMLLAAGLGQRMVGLTSNRPKPLIEVGGRSLIERHLSALASAGFSDLVINLWYLADQIKDRLGDGERYGLRIQYSEEQERLETGGGIKHALPLLGDEPFLVISSDVLTNIDYSCLKRDPLGPFDAHLILIDNPPHHPDGDFSLHQGQLGRNAPKLTYSGIGILRPHLFQAAHREIFPLRDVLFPLVDSGKASGERWSGYWSDVGTPERLHQAEEDIRAGRCP